MKADLIAPCGINCRLCYGYIRPKNPCAGCRGPAGSKPQSCATCKIVVCGKRRENGWSTCALCDTPCRRIKELDKRYSTKYHTSPLENLSLLREKGMEALLQQQHEKYTCPKCGGIFSVHRSECPTCKAAAW